MSRVHRFAILIALVACLPAAGASYIVPSDRDLVQASDAVVVARVLSGSSRYTTSGSIVTDYQIRVDEPIKGALRAGATITVTEVGGVVGDVGLVASSAPRFVLGETALLLLDRRGVGSWSTHSGQLGKFNFVRDDRSALLLVRGARDEEIFGWDVHGGPHVERTRDAAEFLDFIRATVRGESANPTYFTVTRTANASSVISESTFPGQSYLLWFPGFTKGARWSANGFTMATQGTPTGSSAQSVANEAATTWNGDPTSDIAIVISGSAASINYGASNEISVVHFGVPSNFNCQSCSGEDKLPLDDNTVGQALLWATSAEHTLRGEAFFTSVECDIIVESTMTGNLLGEVTAHEMGHCLGFRHSNEDRDPRTTQALMNASVTGRGPVLLDWDREAANAIYGDGTYNTCVAPVIFLQTGSRTIATGQSLMLAVGASGTNLTYQWYRGTAGDEGQPIIGATSSTFSTGALTSTQSYWVKVGSACGTVNSSTITVAVSPTAASSRRRTTRR